MDTTAPGTVLAGRYVLGAQLGSGGTSTVRRAHDRLLGRDVAVKLFPLTAETARIEDEARTLASFSHPGLVAVHDAGTAEDGTPYLVLQLVEGTDLASCCLDGSLAPERVAEVGAQVAEALAHVHARGVVHRDVKPANVLLGADGRARLADFGIARLVDAGRRTATGLLVGTAAYLSPEQVAGGDVGPPTDVHALGLVLLEALTGRREYPGADLEAALARLSRPPVVPQDLPAPWPSLLTRMTAPDPAARPTAEEVAAELAGTAAVLPGTEPHPASSTAVDLAPVAVPVPRDTPRDTARDALRGRHHAGTTAAAQRSPTPSLVRQLAGDRVVWALGGSLTAVVVLVAASVLALGPDGPQPQPAAAGTSTTPAPAPASPSAAGAPGGTVPVVAASLFHPGGSDDDDPQDVPLTVDGDPRTAWTTQRYASRDFGGLRPGVGVLLDTGGPTAVSAVRVRLSLPGADLRVHAGDAAGDGLLQTPALAQAAGAGDRVELRLPGPVRARYWVVWVSRLPEAGRAGISEIALTPG